MFGTRTGFDGMQSHIWSRGLVGRISDLDAAGPEDIISMAKLHECVKCSFGDISGIF